MTTLADIIKPARKTAIVDVGACPSDTHPPYRTMLEMGLCSVIGFEPNPDALTMLRDRATVNETYLHHVVGIGGPPRPFHLYYAHHMNSLLRPDTAALSAFTKFDEWGELRETITVDTTPLDAIPEITDVDMLRMDAQGAELEILAPGGRCLANTVAVVTEVAWVPLYERQPTFGHVDLTMRRLGFVPHCFVEAKVWPITCGSLLPAYDPHQLLESDIMYVRDFTRQMEPEQWKQLAMISHYVAGSMDLTMRCIHALGDPAAKQAYIKLLGDEA